MLKKKQEKSDAGREGEGKGFGLLRSSTWIQQCFLVFLWDASLRRFFQFEDVLPSVFVNNNTILKKVQMPISYFPWKRIIPRTLLTLRTYN